MTIHFFMGAINKNTNEYEYPKIANKKFNYECPHCNLNVIFKKGKINRPHFAHYKSNNPCYYYNKPSESQIHKDAKLLMKKLLNSKIQFNFMRCCNFCTKRNKKCTPYVDHCKIIQQDYMNYEIKLEYAFTYNNSRKIADIAIIKNDKIKYIFEICHRHKTKEENRPEPWFKINAEYLIELVNNIDNENLKCLTLNCIRNYKCNMCITHEKNILEIQSIKYNTVSKNFIQKSHAKIIRNSTEESIQTSTWLSDIQNTEQNIFGKCVGNCGKKIYTKIQYNGKLKNLCIQCFTEKII